MSGRLQKIGLWLYALIESVMVFLVLYTVLFLIGGLISTGELKVEGDITIYVQSNGVHTDLCLPVVTNEMDWKSRVPISDFPNNKTFRYVAIGWGDKGFFLDTPTWADLTMKTAFRAAFLPSETAMHVAYLDQEPVPSEKVIPVFLSTADYAKLIRFIIKSFKQDGGRFELIPNKGYTVYDNFYEANGSYHLFKTCNIWTNDALKVAGVRTGIFALSAEGIMRHLRN